MAVVPPPDTMNDDEMLEPDDGSAQTQRAGGEEERDETTEPPAPAAGDNATSADSSQLQRERDDLYDRLLRKTAEFDNFRKRIEKERREHAEWAAADVLADVLTVLDDFDRALAAEAPAEAQAYRTGVELIRRQLGEVLRKRGVTPIDAMGAEFDPHLHQAVAYEETAGAREGEVIGELRKGYRLGERLLRPALVRVAKAS
ncbi:MAG: nucleotide exchange factor GrpE [Acidobacteriota bacterium]